MRPYGNIAEDARRIGQRTIEGVGGVLLGRSGSKCLDVARRRAAADGRHGERVKDGTENRSVFNSAGAVQSIERCGANRSK